MCSNIIKLVSNSGNMKVTEKMCALEVGIGRSFAPELKARSAPWVAAEKELANANKVIPNLHLWGSSELPRAPIKNAKKYKMAEAFLFCSLFVPDV